jgi:hypothetical protein
MENLENPGEIPKKLCYVIPQPLLQTGSCIREKETNTCHSVIQLIGKWKPQETLVRYPRNLVYDTPHSTAIYTENSKQIFPAMKLRGLVPNIYSTFLYQ